MSHIEYERIKTNLDLLYKEKQISFMEWYLSLVDLRTKYSLVTATDSFPQK
jgi:hypothetical protein